MTMNKVGSSKHRCLQCRQEVKKSPVQVKVWATQTVPYKFNHAKVKKDLKKFSCTCFHGPLFWLWAPVQCTACTPLSMALGVCSKPLSRFQGWRGSVMHVLTYSIPGNGQRTKVARTSLTKTGTSPLNGPIMRQNEAYEAISCTLKTTSSFMFLLSVVQSDHATNRKPAGLVSKAIPAHL